MKAVLFDLDGTMVNTKQLNMIPLQRLLKKTKNVDIPYEDLLSYYNYDGLTILRKCGCFEESEIDEAYQLWLNEIEEYDGKAVIYDGMLELIEWLHEHEILLGIVSSKPRCRYEKEIIAQGYDRYMQIAILAEDTLKHKPNPEPLLKAMEKLNLKGEDVIYLGDSWSDQKACEACHCHFAFAAWDPVSQIDDAKITCHHPMDLIQYL